MRGRGGGNFFWNNPFYTGCMRSSNTRIPIVYIDYQFSFHTSNYMQSSTAYFTSSFRNGIFYAAYKLPLLTVYKPPLPFRPWNSASLSPPPPPPPPRTALWQSKSVKERYEIKSHSLYHLLVKRSRFVFFFSRKRKGGQKTYFINVEAFFIKRNFSKERQTY